jgi:serine/threonine protein kinase
MTTPTATAVKRDQQLNAILLPLVQALENGQVPDRQGVLAAHPEFAAELAEFFAGRDCLARLTGPEPGGLRTPGPAADLGRLGDFRLLREVGRGGMGTVYEAEQLSLNRRVALKVLPFAAALDPRQLQRFKNETQAAALLHHPHIVPIYAVGCERGIHYYTMQFIDGQSLAALIQGLRQPPGGPAPAVAHSTSVPTGGTPAAPPWDRIPILSSARQDWNPVPQSPPDGLAAAGIDTVSPPAGNSTERSSRRWKSQYCRRVAHLGRTAAEALEHAHQLGVVHRDVKPANLLLDRRGELWVTDFGLALLQNTAGPTATGELVGTLRYMSPEQAGAQRGLVDHRTDVYSLGVTLYELLTLHPLFEGDDPRRLLRQIAEEEPRPPRSVDDAIPVELDLVVLKALAKDPAERYATAQELADDLQRFLGDQPVRARRPTLLDWTTKWARRHRGLVASAVGMLLLATTGLLLSTVLIARAYKGERQKAEEAEQQRARAEANFLQARRTLDFLTQASAEELVDRPELLEVRRKLLEGARQYYQEFIDQHQGDSSTQAELIASRARVAQILNALYAQQEYFRRMLMTMLLEEGAVQEDLRLTPAQEGKVFGLFDRFREQRRQAFRLSGTLSEAEREKRFKEMAAASDQAVAALLTPAQVTRLKQIALQQRVPQAFSEAEVAEALHLTPDQKVRIRAVQDDAQRAVEEAARQVRGPAEADEKARQVGQSAAGIILAALTPEQVAGWKELTGEPFRGRIHFSSRIGFDGPEPVRPGRDGPGHGPGPGPGRRPGDGPPPAPPPGHGREPDHGPPGPGAGRRPGRSDSD